jgi:capsular exopolysaccharide synthesis family protein
MHAPLPDSDEHDAEVQRSEPAMRGRHPGPITYTRTPTVEIAQHVLERHRIASVNHDDNADAFRVLCTQLIMEMRANGWRTLAVTSPNRGAGKSTIALNLAISFGIEMDSTALLVDADLREPDLRNLLEIGPGPGLSDYLLGRATVPNLLLHPNLGNLVLLPGGSPVKFTSELMRSPMMAKLVHEVATRYTDRLTVFDMPPVLQGADALALSSMVDATILLVEEGRTSRQDIKRACDLLRPSNLIGVLLNKSRFLPDAEPQTRRKGPGFFRRHFGSA